MEAIAEKAGLDRNSVRLCKRHKEGGIERALHDGKGSGRPVEFTDEEKACVINIACPPAVGQAKSLVS